MNAASLQTHSRADRRQADRRDYGRPGTLRIAGGDAIEIVVQDLSRDGCCIETDTSLTRDLDVAIGLPGVGIVDAKVMWHGTRGYGCAFSDRLKPGTVTAAFSSNVGTIRPLPSSAPDHGASDTRRSEKISVPKRMAVIAGSSVALWAIILFAAMELNLLMI